MNEIIWRPRLEKKIERMKKRKKLGHRFHSLPTVSLYEAEGGFNIIKSTLCLLTIKRADV